MHFLPLQQPSHCKTHQAHGYSTAAIARHARVHYSTVRKQKGQVFVGIDVIGDYLTEINVTSPTGIQELERFDGTNTARRLWQVIEAKRAAMA